MKIIFSIACMLIFSGVLLGQEVVKSEDGKYRQNGEIYTGTHKTYHSNGELATERTFVNGLEHGISLYFFENLQKKEERAFKEGKKDGKWTTWNVKGQVTAIAHYLSDKKHGKWFVYHGGVKRFEMNYDNGEKVGTWFMWDENGELISEKTF